MPRDTQPAPSGEDPLADVLGDLAGRGRLTVEDEDGPGSAGRHRGRVGLLSVPASLRSIDLGVGVRAARGLLVVGLVVLVVLGGRWAWAVRSAAPEPTDVVRAAADTGHDPNDRMEVRASTAADPSTTSTDHPDPSASPTPVDLLVHVAGQVGAPGVVTVPPGARVVDAVEAAGGFTREADRSALNLARPVVDGEQIWVGRPGESPPSSAGPPPVAGGSASTGTSGSPGRSPAGSAGPLDLNGATQADLEELPGIGPVTAGHILAWRETHGRFTRVDELLEVSGIGERTLARLEPLVTVGG